MTDSPIATKEARQRLDWVYGSFHRLTGRYLVAPKPDLDLWQASWTAPRVIVAHGTEEDPIFFYGNQLALGLFELDFAAFTQLPSRYSAEPMLREEREALLERVRKHGYIDDYAGIRVSASGRRFRIEQATVWNVFDDSGTRHGQAATFEHWFPVPAKESGAI